MHFLPFTRLPNHALPFNIFSSFKKYVYPTVSFIACFLLWEADYIITVLEILICYLEILVWDVQSKSPFIYSRAEPWELCTVMACPMWKKIASMCRQTWSSCVSSTPYLKSWPFTSFNEWLLPQSNDSGLFVFSHIVDSTVM